MKPRFKKAMTLVALVSLGVTGLASCGGKGDDANSLIKLTPSWSESDTLFAGTKYSLEAKYDANENAKFLFSSNAPSAFKMETISNSKIDFSFTKEGNYTITASLEEDATINSTINVKIAQGEVSYRIETDSDLMESTTFEQGSPFNSDGLAVYKTKYVGENATDTRIALSSDDYDLFINYGDEDIQLLDGTILKVAGDFDIKVVAHDEKVLPGSFSITVASRPTYLADQFFEEMKDEYSVALLGEDDKGDVIPLPWLIKTKEYIMSFDSALMGTHGVGFYLDNENYVRQFYLDEARSTAEKVEFTAGKQLYVDALDEQKNVVRTRIDDLNYAKGFFKYTDGNDYDKATFGKEGKPTLADNQTIFSFEATAKTQAFLTGLIGITELLNYGFTVTSQIAFADSAVLGVTALLSIKINIPGGGSTGGSFVITNGKMEEPSIEAFLQDQNKVVNEANNKNLESVFDIVRGNNFVGSDESNFVDGFQDANDQGYGIYYATPDSYMVSTGFKQSAAAPAQHLKNGVITLKEGETTNTAGTYAFASTTAEGNDAQIKEITDPAIFNQYMPKNWPGFTNKDDKTATIPNNDYTSQWLIQTLPMPSYKRDSNGDVMLDGNNQPIVIGYDYQYRLAGSATSVMWLVVSSMTPGYAGVFAGDSLILNVSTDLENNVTAASIVFHGSISKASPDQPEMFSSCNIISMNIDIQNVGKTVNPHIQKFIENNKPVEQK